MTNGLAALRLLVIDDNAQMRSIIGTVLTAAGVRHLHYAQDGRRGLEALATFQIDAVYVDHEMPVMNGLEFLSRVRAGPSPECYLPIIMLTGHSELEKLTTARDRGVTEFLCKPVTARSILTRLNAVITQPRPFVKSENYFGPDRRRIHKSGYDGPLRRRLDAQTVQDVMEI
jgi:DNA-binding response OmpR family regulator